MDPQRVLNHSARADADVQRRLSGLARLLGVTRELAAEIDLTRILELVTRQACEALDCERASLYRHDPVRHELFTTVVTELEIAEIRNSLEQGITGYAARNRVVTNVADPASDPRWNSSVDRLTGFRTRSILAAPLTSPEDGSLLGVLQLLNKQGGPFDEFDEELLAAFSQHAAVALDRARLLEELRKQQAVELSLRAARDIQRGFMPTRLPDIPHYEVATWWLPNQAVGGDYCDLIPLRDGRMGLVIADVSGHGLGPSLIMASVRAALRALILSHSLPELLLSQLGHALSGDLQEGRFITMVMACLDPVAHTVEYANAGHAPAEHYRAATGRFSELEATGLPLGVLDRPEYPQGPAVRMDVGDLIVLCTDGIVEAMNDEDVQFGGQRLREIIHANSRRPVAELVHEVGRHVSEYYAGDSPPDDLTVLAVRRNE